MTNPIAVTLGLLIVGFIALDLFVLEADVMLFVLRKFIDLIEYLAFWR